MLLILKIIYENLQQAINVKPHPSMAHLPFLGSPWPIMSIVAAYLLFVLKLGPAFMKTRKAYNLKKVLLAYNIAQIVMCVLFNYYTTWALALGYDYDLLCMTHVPDDHPHRRIEVGCHYAYFIFKIIDLLDTVFFVLRKSYRQVTFLHVYHHVLMVAFGYCYSHYYGARGHMAGMAYVNGIVHTFMYTYYFASAFSPEMKNSIRIKKFITIMQLVQFVIILGHQAYPLLYRPDCEYPRFLLYFCMLQAIIMIALFGNFYRKAYLQPNGVQSGNVKIPICILSTGGQIGSSTRGVHKGSLTNEVNLEDSKTE